MKFKIVIVVVIVLLILAFVPLKYVFESDSNPYERYCGKEDNYYSPMSLLTKVAGKYLKENKSCCKITVNPYMKVSGWVTSDYAFVEINSKINNYQNGKNVGYEFEKTVITINNCGEIRARENEVMGSLDYYSNVRTIEKYGNTYRLQKGE